MNIGQLCRGRLLAVAAAGTMTTLAGEARPATQASGLSWMAGHWLECSTYGEAAETWADDREGVMLGLSKSIRNGRTSWELSRIDRTPKGITFFASPKGQPATAFKGVSIVSDRAVFEKLDHDFPQRVIYMRQDDRLTGRIEGIIDSKPRAVDWHYRLSPLNATCPAVSPAR